MKFKVTVEMTYYGDVVIDALNKDDAIKKLNDRNFLDRISHPNRVEYVEDSLIVSDFDSLEEIEE